MTATTAAAANAAVFAVADAARAAGATVAEVERILSSTFVEARYLKVGDRVFTAEGTLLYVGTPDVILGQDGYVSVRGTDVADEAVSAVFDLDEVVEVLL